MDKNIKITISLTLLIGIIGMIIGEIYNIDILIFFSFVLTVPSMTMLFLEFICYLELREELTSQSKACTTKI